MDVTEQHPARAALEKTVDEIKQLKDELDKVAATQPPIQCSGIGSKFGRHENTLGNPLFVSYIYLCAGVEFTDDHEAGHATLENAGRRTGCAVLRS